MSDEDFGGFFDGVDDVEDVSNDPFYMPDDVYRWKIVSAEAKKTKDGSKTGLNVKLQCSDGPYKGNIQWAPWRRIPKRTDEDFKDTLEHEDDDVRENATATFKKLQAQLRKDFEAYGIPADQLLKVLPKDLLGLEVMGRVRTTTNDDGEKERKIIGLYKVDEISGEDGTGGFGQFINDGNSPF